MNIGKIIQSSIKGASMLRLARLMSALMVILFVTAFQLQAADCNGVIVLVHGAFADKETWWQPGGSFHDELAKQAKELGMRVETFKWKSGWHGGFMGQSVEKAGKKLATQVQPYALKTPIYFVGHSQGAGVAMAACKTLSKRGVKKYRKNDQEVYPITRIYTLAPTITNPKIDRAMEVTGSVVNLFSLEDEALAKLEPLGVYDRVYEYHSGVVNYLVKNVTKDGKLTMFGHSEIHDALIARWLLQINPPQQEAEPVETKSKKKSDKKKKADPAVTLAALLLSEDDPPEVTELEKSEYKTIRNMRILSGTSTLFTKTLMLPRAIHGIAKKLM